MDAVEFLKEKDRMCKSFDQTVCRDRDDVACELRHKSSKENISCYEYIKKHPAEAVEIVEQWAKEHPVKTRQSEFLKMFPKAKVDANNVITICPYETCISYKCDLIWGESTEPKCHECRKKYWLEEVD